MLKSTQTTNGITLIEMLLVLLIGISLVVMSFRQYRNFRLDADMLQLKNNVDILFQAAAGYYQANCSPGGSLYPTIATEDTKIISIPDDLINAGFLAPNFPQANPLVNSVALSKGYAVQFNKYTAPRMQPICADPPNCTSSIPTQVGTIITWKIQVSVRLLNTTIPQLLSAKNYLNATGILNHDIVFERMPSYATSNSMVQSTFWVSNPLLKQFKEMYTTNPITDLTNQAHSTEYQYYYCGS